MRVVAAFAGLSVLALSAVAIGAETSADPAARPGELWMLLSPDGPPRDFLLSSLRADLARTPQSWEVRISEIGELAGEEWPARARILLEVVLETGEEAAVLELAHAEGLATPGWLVHSVLQASRAIGQTVEFADRRSSWLGQLVGRSTRRLPASGADVGLSRGVPSLRLRLPEELEGSGARLLAAVTRRLGGLDGPPRFEDEFLVAGGRVWLRRDLYWLGLALWLLLYWRGRRRPGREFRWAFLIAWSLAPVFGFVLLSLPALVAVWHPVDRRWVAAIALLPTALYAGRLAIALADGARLVVAGLPVLVILIAIGTFAWDGFGSAVKRSAEPAAE